MLSKLVKEFDAYSRESLIAMAGGLHIAPVNHSHAIRLNAASYVAVTSKSQSTSRIESSEFHKIINSCMGEGHPLTHHEDQNGNLFTQNIIFHGGNFIVYPGIDEGGALPLQSLLSAIFLAPPSELSEFVDRVRSSTMGLLVISDAIARRNGHQRNVQVDSEEKGVIDQSEITEVDTLVESVCFSNEELRAILRSRSLLPECLTPFICHESGSSTREYSPDENPLVTQPLVQTESGIIVTIPTSLCFALRKFLWNEIKSSEHQVLIANRLADTQLFEIQQIFKISGYEVFAAPFADGSGQLRESLLQFDDDKLLLVHVCIGEEAFGDSGVSDSKCTEWVEERRTAVNNQFRRDYKLLNLILFVNSGLELFFSFGVDSNLEIETILSSPWALLLVLSQERHDRLDLWKFCRLKTETEKKTQIFSFCSFIEEYAFYLSHRRSFYPGDDARPTMISLVPGWESLLYNKAIVIPDIHLAYLPSTGHLKEVRRISRDLIPIYAAKPFSGFPRHLVEFEDLNLWIACDQKPAIEPLYSSWDLVSCFSYWMLQLCKAVPEFVEFRPKTIEFFIAIHQSREELVQLISDTNITCREVSAQNGSGDAIFIERKTAQEVIFHFSSPCMELINNSDNYFDKLVVRSICTALWLAKFDPESSTELPSSFEAICNALTANKNRRMMLALDPNMRPCLNPNNLGELRFVDDHDVDEHLSELVIDLDKEKYSAGEIVEKEKKVKLGHFLVRIFLNRILKATEAFDSPSLLHKLLALHEAAVHEQVKDLQTARFRHACHFDDDSFLSRTGEDRQRFSKVALSLRALIEIVAACPKSGKTPTTEDIDNLVALGELLVSWGRISDEINYDLVPHQISILRSGRVGVDRTPLGAQDRFIREKLLEEVDTYKTKDEESEGEDQILALIQSDEGQSALRAEWGANFVETYQFSQALFMIALPSTESVITIPFEQLVNQIEAFNFGFSKEQIRSLLEQFSYVSRTKMMEPPQGYEKSDLFPWRYNRLLSLMRRPLIRHLVDGVDTFTFGARTTVRCFETLLRNLTVGAIAYRSPEMTALMGKINNIRGSDFNKRCEKWFKANSTFLVDSNVSMRPGGKIEATSNLGDVDVLLVDRQKQILYSIECKDVNFAKEPHQMNTEWLKFSDGNEDSWSAKHLRRDARLGEWVVGNSTSPYGDLSSFKVVSLILVAEELPTQHLKKFSLPVISFPKLKREGLSSLPT